MHLKLPDNSIFLDELFDVVYILSNGTTKKVPIYKNNINRISPKEFEYSFLIKLKYNDWIEIFLAQRNHSTRDNDVRYSKNTSNKVKIYLSSLR
jgi:hypothetical protein